jgi:hypothetical protein
MTVSKLEAWSLELEAWSLELEACSWRKKVGRAVAGGEEEPGNGECAPRAALYCGDS